MSTKIFINLPVGDLSRSVTFFQSLGFDLNLQFTDENAACIVIEDGSIYAMLITKPFFRNFTKKEIADATQTTEVLLALEAGSREQVDELVRRAVAAGGSIYRDPDDHGWMYGHSFADPDGHQWEVVYMDMSRMPQPDDERQTITASVAIRAPAEKVWQVLLGDDTYRAWTSVFYPGSYAESDWREGSRALFKSPDGNGMISRVRLHRPNEIISFEHLGVLAKGQEDFDGAEAQKWKGATETYRVSEENGHTLLTIEQDIAGQYAGWFRSTWEKALQKVKELSE